MKKEQIEHIALMAIGCIAVGYVSVAFVFKPQWKKFKKSATESVEIQDKLERARSKVNSLPGLRKNTRALDAAVAEEERRLKEDSFEAFVKTIKNAAIKAGVELKRIRPRDDVEIARGSQYAERWVTVETRAPYHVIGRWMKGFEEQSPYVRVVSITIRSSQGSAGFHEADLTVGFLVKRKTQ